MFRAGAIVGAASFLPVGLFGCATDVVPTALGRIVDDGVAPRAFDRRGLSWLLSPVEGRVEVRDADGTLVQAVDGLAYPSAIAIDAAGRGWIVELGAGTLACIDLERATTTRVGAGTLRTPRDVAVDAEGRLLVAEIGTHQVLRLDERGRVVESLGAPIERGPADEEGVLNGPRSLAVALDGSILVAELGAARVTRLASDGTWLETVVSGFVSPRTLRVGPDGRFAVADVVRGDVSVYDARGALLTTYRPSARLADAIAFAPDGALWVSGREQVFRG